MGNCHKEASYFKDDARVKYLSYACFYVIHNVLYGRCRCADDKSHMCGTHLVCVIKIGIPDDRHLSNTESIRN